MAIVGMETYDINNDNQACGRIIQLGCDNIFNFVDPCDILSQCIPALIPPVDRCDMVAEIPNPASLRILRISGPGNCVERADPCSIFNACYQDIRVKVSNNDTTPGFLATKIISCDPSKLSITIGNPGGDERLILCPNFPTTFLQLEDVPNAYPSCNGSNGGYVMFNSITNQVEFDCFESYRAERYLNQDSIINQPANQIKAYVFSDSPSVSGGAIPTTILSYYEGHPQMKGNNGEILIQRNGMYRVKVYSALRVNKGVHAVRIFAITDNNKKMLCNAVRGGQNQLVNPLHLNRPLPSDNRENEGFFLLGENLVRLNAGERVFMGTRIDSNANNNEPAIARYFRSTLGSGTYDSGTEFSNPHTGMHIRVERTPFARHNAM